VKFLAAKDKQLVLKQVYLDFSLLRIHFVDYNGEKEGIMVE
jgi:hypothetical protein